MSIPQQIMGADPGPVRDFAQAVEDLGFQFVATSDHVLGADTRNRPGWVNKFTSQSVVHEPMVLFGYLAGVTKHLGFTAKVLVLPQRQTALVAKQAAEVDLLSGGRLRLGVGLGWNEVEFEALGSDIHNRGSRIEEQIAVLRALWTQEVVDFHGRWHRISAAGINPLPVQRPIPIWMGGTAEASLQRIGRLADGWIPMSGSDEEMLSVWRRIQGYAAESGRDPGEIRMDARFWLSQTPPSQWKQRCAFWCAQGASHLTVDTRDEAFLTLEDHLHVLEKFAEALGMGR